MREWREFLAKHLQTVIEDVAKKNAPVGNYTGKVRFLVKEDGSVSQFTALNDPGHDIAKKVLKIMSNSP